jgi:riboflavin kinase / FMN adenylyltransferase
MIIHEGYENLNLVKPVVTLGVFDGVHRGHTSLLARLITRAREMGSESAVVTFHPHPRVVLEKKREKLTLLTTMEEKKALLGRQELDHLIIMEFNREVSNIAACDFIKEVLLKKIGATHLLIGYNHHFGRGGEGDVKTLSGCASSYGFTVEQVEGFYTEAGPVSSSMIREALLNGQLEDANRWLGYNYSMKGTVVAGRKLGREIGFPTANIKPDYDYKLVPARGVYAVIVMIEGLIHKGMLSIGSNPTVNEDVETLNIEVNIFDFEKDVYGKSISLFFISRLRDEIRFDSTEQLALQMEIDKQQAITLLGQ